MLPRGRGVCAALGKADRNFPGEDFVRKSGRRSGTPAGETEPGGGGGVLWVAREVQSTEPREEVRGPLQPWGRHGGSCKGLGAQVRNLGLHPE